MLSSLPFECPPELLERGRGGVPTPTVVAGAGSDRLAPYAELIKTEVNVKAVVFSDAIEDFGSFQLQINAKVMGPKLGPAMKPVMVAAKKGDWTKHEDGTVTVGDVTLEEGEYTMRLQAKEGVVSGSLSTKETSHSWGAGDAVGGGVGDVALATSLHPLESIASPTLSVNCPIHFGFASLRGQWQAELPSCIVLLLGLAAASSRDRLTA